MWHKLVLEDTKETRMYILFYFKDIYCDDTFKYIKHKKPII